MACTKETYTATATWTQAQLANLFKDAFIDAGLMTDWHDSFLSGTVENRILAVTYDNTKTYGTTYYWFKFVTGGVFLSVATGWNASTHVPTGTQYLDYSTATTNSSGDHWQILSTSTAATQTLVRYTSGVDSDQSWFVCGSGLGRFAFTIVKPQMTLQPWMDLGKGLFCGFAWARPWTYSTFPYANLAFCRGPSLRRDLTLGSALRDSTNPPTYNITVANVPIIVYGAVGNSSSGFGNNAELGFSYTTGAQVSTFGTSPGAIILPNNFTGTNPAFPSNSNPVYHSMPFMPYINENFPSDFGVTFQYATNTFSHGAQLIVSAGLEEWEVVHFTNNASAATSASPLLVARMV